MQNFKRLVSWVHDFKADTPEQADQLARITAEAVNTALKPLGHGTAWAAIVTDEDCGEGGLTDILAGLYLLDEDEGCVAHVPAEETVVPERLIAWRDASADRHLWLTVPAHQVRPGDVIDLSGEWCTVERNDDSTEGETSTRSILVSALDGGGLRTLSILALVNVAVLRPKAGA